MFMLKVGIDLSNIRSGGGVTHIKEILCSLNAEENNVKFVVVWGGDNTLNQLEDRPWLIKKRESWLNRSIIFRLIWQRFFLTKKVKNEKCDILFVPGGSYHGNFAPFVSMSQNLLPFEKAEINRYRYSKFYFKLLLLQFGQIRTFERSNGVIFLTNFARDRVFQYCRLKNTIVINHGINPKFFHPPKAQLEISSFNVSKPMRLLYVSFIGEYKHQWNVVEAVKLLKEKGYPVEITFIGEPTEKKAFKKFQDALDRLDPERRIVSFYPNIPYNDVHTFYLESDIFIFASSCETFGQILTEAMASGLPIVCSNMSAMPEILGDSGVYFNPLDPNDLENSLVSLIESRELRSNMANSAYKKSLSFNWELASKETFKYINQVYRDFNKI